MAFDISKINAYAVLDIRAPMATKLNGYVITNSQFNLSISKINAYLVIDELYSPPVIGGGNMFMLF